MTTSTIAVSAAKPVLYRVDAIPLFGSQLLERHGDSNGWFFTTSTTQPEPLTERESMFVNAAFPHHTITVWCLLLSPSVFHRWQTD